MNISIIHPVEMDKHFLTQGFAENRELYKQFIVKGFPLQGHNGHDFATPNGQRAEIYAAATGIISKISYEIGGFGQHIWIQHQGFRTLYAHLSHSVYPVRTEINQGTVIGHTGSTGFSTGVHLHFGLYPDGEPGINGFGGAVDPAPYYGNGAEFNSTGILEFTARPSGNLIAIFTKPSKWKTKAKARRK